MSATFRSVPLPFHERNLSMFVDDENGHSAPDSPTLRVDRKSSAVVDDNPWGHTAFSDGTYLIVRRAYSELPMYCVRTNEPTDSVLRQRLLWHRGWIGLLLFVHVLAYALVAVLVLKHAVVEVPISDDVAAKRARVIWIAWIGCIATALVMTYVVCLSGDRGSLIAIVCIVGIVAFLSFGIYGIVLSKVVFAKKIDKHFAFLLGASPDYLKRLPPWPGPRV